MQIAKLYKFPLSVFYLNAPLKNFQVMHDFRKLPEELIENIYLPTLKYEIRLAQQRRELALEFTQYILHYLNKRAKMEILISII